MVVTPGPAGLHPYINSVVQNTKNGNTVAVTGFQIGSPYSGNLSQLWNGHLSEFEIFPSALSNLDRISVESDQSCYYSIIPTVVPTAIPSVPLGAVSANLGYTAGLGSPVSYSISWDAVSLAAGFVNIIDFPLPASPVIITVPAGAIEGGVYSGSFSVKNSCGISSVNYPIVVRVMAKVLGTSTYPSAAF